MAKKKEAFIEVAVTTLGKDTVTLRLKKGASLADALVAAGHGADSLANLVSSARVNRAPADLGQTMKDGDEIMVAPNVKGGA